MASQPWPYLEESVKLVPTPLSRSVNYSSVAVNNNNNLAVPVTPFQILNVQHLGSPQPQHVQSQLNLFKMSSRYNLKHEPRHYFFYISVLCMIYCVIYRLFFYYLLYSSLSISILLSIISFNAAISLILLLLLIFLLIIVTTQRIKEDRCSPTNIQILLFSILRFIVIYILNIIIIICADSFILFTFISYIFQPSSSSHNNHVDVFWQSIRKFLNDSEGNEREKLNRLITIHWYCLQLYLNKKNNKFSNINNYNAGIFGRKQQQKAIRRLHPIIKNEYYQITDTYNNIDQKQFKFGISTPKSLSSYYINNISSIYMLTKRDLQIWFSVILWMPIFRNDSRYYYYYVIEKILLKCALIIILFVLIYSETKYAFKYNINISITTSVRCVAEVINLLNLIPFVIYDDPDFDNVAELYSSREISSSLSKKKTIDIVKEINIIYYKYCNNLKKKQLNTNNNNNYKITPMIAPMSPLLTLNNQQKSLQSLRNNKQYIVMDITPAPSERGDDTDEEYDTDSSITGSS